MNPTSVLKFLARILVPPFHLKGWRWLRLAIMLCVDWLVLSGAYWCAFYLRLENLDFGRYQDTFWKSLPILLIIHTLVFFMGGIYRQVWRFANAHSAVLILRSLLYGSVLSYGIFWFSFQWPPPRSVMTIFFLISSFMVGIEKFSWRLWTQFQKSLEDDPRDRCLIFGAGEAGELFSRHINMNDDFQFTPVGFLDDDKNKKGRVIHGYKIYGGRDHLVKVCRKLNAKTIVFAMPSTPGKEIREIVNICKDANITPLIMPNITNLIDNHIVQPRNVAIKDLLRRAPKSVDKASLFKFFANQTVLITGAGGSIGTEICRQVLQCSPKRLVILDSSEFNLFQIEHELDQLEADCEIHPLLTSVTDEDSINRIFERFRPDCILHAAAYKHVPMVEKNALAGLKNNIIGTKTVCDAAITFKTKNFILISTDKAVNPCNTMGASKRCCEILLQSYAQQHQDICHFSAVRFGNVLGSSGSVVPRFMEQIQQGGPVTVTHPDINRFFMLTSEAVGLVLQAAAKSTGGEIFVLNMGEPVKIYDMAKHLIELAGKEPGKDIEIKFTGLRPGEKLFEELILKGTEKTTLHDDIFILKRSDFDSINELKKIDNLIQLITSGQEEAAVKLARKLANPGVSDSKPQAESDNEPLVH